MKDLKNRGISSTTTKAAASANRSLLSAAQQEALVKFFSQYGMEQGQINIKLGDVELHLNLAGRCRVPYDGVWKGKCQVLADAILKEWKLSILNLRLETPSWGQVRHLMMQASRGFASQAKGAKTPEERIALLEVSKRLQTKNETKETVSFLSALRSVLVNTFEVLKGQHGKVRISVIIERKTTEELKKQMGLL